MDRPFTVLDCDQHLEDGTANPDWIAARLGLVTGSNASDMLAAERVAGKGMRSKLKRRLAYERLTGQPFGKDVQTAAMAQGLRREPEARIAYERLTNTVVMSCGFVAHNVYRAGCSPDGYINDFEGLVSIKCPEQAQHLEYLRVGVTDAEYLRQMDHEKLITGALWHDFVSFNPEMTEKMRLVVIRIGRNDIDLKKHEDALIAFQLDLDTEYLALKTIVDGIGAVA